MVESKQVSSLQEQQQQQQKGQFQDQTQLSSNRGDNVKEFVQDVSEKPTKSVHTATTARPIGFMENWFHRMKYSMVSIVDVKGPPLDQSILTQALKSTSMRHPILRCNIDREHAGRRICVKELIHHPFIEPKFIDSSYNDWEKVAEKELNVDFHVGGDFPLWRVCVILSNKEQEQQDQKLIISMHRCFSDATSMGVIINSILYYYNEIATGNNKKEKDSFDQLQQLPMLCDAEELYFLTNKMDEDYVQKASKEQLKKFLNYEPVIPLDHENHQEAHRHCKHLCKAGAKDNFDNMKRVEKERNVTLQSIIIACTWFAAIKTFSNNNVTNSLKLDYVMDFRKLVQPILGDEHVGSLFGLTEMKLPLTLDTKFWDLCQLIQQKLQQSVHDKEPMYWHPIQRNVNIDSNQFVEHLRTICGRYGDLILEDSSAYPFPRTIGSYEIQSIHTMFGNLPYGWTVALNVGSVLSMSYSCTYDSSLMDESTVRKFFDCFVNMLESSHQITDELTIKTFQ